MFLRSHLLTVDRSFVRLEYVSPMESYSNGGSWPSTHYRYAYALSGQLDPFPLFVPVYFVEIYCTCSVLRIYRTEVMIMCYMLHVNFQLASIFLKDLFNFLGSKEYLTSEYKILRSFPRKDVSTYTCIHHYIL